MYKLVLRICVYMYCMLSLWSLQEQLKVIPSSWSKLLPIPLPIIKASTVSNAGQHLLAFRILSGEVAKAYILFNDSLTVDSKLRVYQTM